MEPKLRRLRELRPWELGLSSERELLGVQRRVQGLLTMTSEVVAGEPVSAYACSIRAIVAYAQTGAGDAQAVLASALEVLSALYSAPVRVVSPVEDSFVGLDPEEAGSEAVLACAAALGRGRVLRDEPVPDGWLAALASVSAESIRVYTYARPSAQAPALRRPEGRQRLVTAESARAFLSERGVAL